MFCVMCLYSLVYSIYIDSIAILCTDILLFSALGVYMTGFLVQFSLTSLSAFSLKRCSYSITYFATLSTLFFYFFLTNSCLLYLCPGVFGVGRLWGTRCWCGLPSQSRYARQLSRSESQEKSSCLALWERWKFRRNFRRGFTPSVSKLTAPSEKEPDYPLLVLRKDLPK